MRRTLLLLVWILWAPATALAQAATPTVRKSAPATKAAPSSAIKPTRNAAPDSAAPEPAPPDANAEVLRGVAPEVLLSNPERFRGRVLEWHVQFITLERAEKIRTDFYEGEPFILARPPGDQPGFIYIAVPAAQLGRVRRLPPLERITILARVRTGRSDLLAAPILDLLELR